jgi:hypothetical protein
MQRVYKYAVESGRFKHLMTDRVDMLDVQLQHGDPQLWALVDVSATPQWRHFVTVGTGWEIPERIVGHVGSFQVEGGALVFHVFELHPTGAGEIAP